MRSLVSCAEASRLDVRTRERAALPALLLMEDASLRIWDALRPIAERLEAGKSRMPLVALCGAGNNAGDALAVLRHAHFAGFRELAVILGREELGEPSISYLESLRVLGVRILAWGRERDTSLDLMAHAALIVDGIAGTGLDGPLRDGLAGLAVAANACGRPVASIDVPSGLRDAFRPGDVLVRATWTVSVEPRKAALYAPAQRSSCGEILSADGIFPADAVCEDPAPGASTVLIEASDLPSWLPAESPDVHKGVRGRLAVFAGSIGSTGAACLASRAALAAGAGLAALFASPEILPIVASRLESVMVKPEPENPGAIDPSRWDAVLAGPGWGMSDRNRAALGRLLSSGLPAVLDADAIRLYRQLRDSGFAPTSPLLLTPHPGEFEALTGLSRASALADPAAALREQASRLGAVIVLKSHITWIAAPDGRIAVWEGREGGLATAGSGDVLAGLAAGILCSLNAAGAVAGCDALFAAACAAVVAHGLAGRRARARRGWFEAGDLVAEAARTLGRVGRREIRSGGVAR